jgi:hypothetical protein
MSRHHGRLKSFGIDIAFDAMNNLTIKSIDASITISDECLNSLVALIENEQTRLARWKAEAEVLSKIAGLTPSEKSFLLGLKNQNHPLTHKQIRWLWDIQSREESAPAMALKGLSGLIAG